MTSWRMKATPFTYSLHEGYEGCFWKIKDSWTFQLPAICLFLQRLVQGSNKENIALVVRCEGIPSPTVDLPHRGTINAESVSMSWCYHDHDDVIKCRHFPRYWPFVRGIHRSPVNSPHKGQWRGALMFSLICAWINGWVNKREAGDLRRHRAHYDVIVMWLRQPPEASVNGRDK